MNYIKVLATDSTNTELKKRYRNGLLSAPVCLYTFQQTQGKGQRSESWQTEHHKNLTFSLLLDNLNLDSAEYFKLNALVSIGVLAFLQSKISKIPFFLKWPNDILADHQKICGILIENFLKGRQIHHSIIGIGLNVNQTEFTNLPRASSLKKLSQIHFELETLLKEMAEFLTEYIYANLCLSLPEVLQIYEEKLFRIHQTSIFQFPDGSHQVGIIKGVSPQGKLQVLIQDCLEEFALKEIKLLY